MALPSGAAAAGPPPGRCCRHRAARGRGPRSPCGAAGPGRHRRPAGRGRPPRRLGSARPMISPMTCQAAAVVAAGGLLLDQVAADFAGDPVEHDLPALRPASAATLDPPEPGLADLDDPDSPAPAVPSRPRQAGPQAAPARATAAMARISGPARIADASSSRLQHPCTRTAPPGSLRTGPLTPTHHGRSRSPPRPAAYPSWLTRLLSMRPTRRPASARLPYIGSAPLAGPHVAHPAAMSIGLRFHFRRSGPAVQAPKPKV